MILHDADLFEAALQHAYDKQQEAKRLWEEWRYFIGARDAEIIYQRARIVEYGKEKN